MAALLIAVTHLLGAGHLTRAAALARAAAQAGHRVTLVSGGMPGALVRVDGVELVQLPPVQGRPDDLSTLRDESFAPVGAGRLADRCALLLATLARTRPDVLITELFPFGRRALAGEFTALVEDARASHPRPAILCSIRDILVAPDRPAKRDRTHDLVRRLYDAVLVHSDPALVPLEASWPVDDELASRLVYTGYVDGESDPAPAAGERSGIIVAGGSSAAALPLYRAAVAALAGRPDGRTSRILVGRGVAEAEFGRLRERAGGRLAVERARPDVRTLLRGAELFVGQAGYNTVTDLFATGPRALLVPFEAGRETEQRLRAERLASLGLATLLPEAELSAGTLARAIGDGLAAPLPASRTVSRDGARETAAIVGRFAARRAAA